MDKKNILFIKKSVAIAFMVASFSVFYHVLAMQVMFMLPLDYPDRAVYHRMMTSFLDSYLKEANSEVNEDGMVCLVNIGFNKALKKSYNMKLKYFFYPNNVMSFKEMELLNEDELSICEYVLTVEIVDSHFAKQHVEYFSGNSDFFVVYNKKDEFVQSVLYKQGVGL